MVKRTCLALAALLAGAGSGCLLYTPHINHAPTVMIIGPDTVTFGTQPMFTAKASDPDQAAASLSYAWRLQAGACPDLKAAEVAAPQGTTALSFVPDASLTSDSCVWVVVRDNDGAAVLGTLPIKLTHLDPDAVLTVVKPKATPDDHYPLFTSFQLSGADSADSENKGGQLTWQFSVVRGDQPVARFDCDPASDAELCFVGDQPGTYTVQMTVTDARNHKQTIEKKLTVDDDSPPCIRQTAPQFLDASTPYTIPQLPKFVRDPTDLSLEVTAVDDDGDPFPFIPGRQETLDFSWTWWYEGGPGSGQQPDGRKPDHRSLAIFNNYFKPGDQIYIRLQVNDRVKSRNFAACASADVANCALGKDPTCYQWVTWKFDLRLGHDM